jgi:hypothetical protein
MIGLYRHCGMVQLSLYEDSLWAGRLGDRIPVGADLPQVQTDPGVHPASYTKDTQG